MKNYGIISVLIRVHLWLSWPELPLADGPAAVHREYDPRDETGLVAAQVDRGVAAILWLTRTRLERLLGLQEALDRWVADCPRRHRGFDQTRSDHVDADSNRRVAGGSQPAHGDDAGLGGRVGAGVEVVG